jgi:short-subunit dehydrogenase
MNQRIWLITGVSGGLGLALMKEVLKAGDVAIGTVRKVSQLETIENLHEDRAHAYVLDVCEHEPIERLQNTIAERFGRLDVLVNNAGFGYFGAMEELSMEECRDQFETNVFGAIKMSQVFLPMMRKAGKGHILQISSVAGMRSAAGLGIYNASKYALEGFSEAMYHELKELGIKVHLIEPGPFRTEFAGSSGKDAARSIKAYESTAGEFKRMMRAKSGTQEGDPVKAAQKMIKLVNAEDDTLRLPLGRYALDAIRAKMKWVERELSDWESDIVDTDFDE